MGKAYTFKTKSFSATIVLTEPSNIQKRLRYNSPIWLQHELNKYAEGEKVTVTIHNEKPKRTENQNRYYWGVYLPLIATETGEHDLDRLHELFKGKFLTKEIVKVLGQDVRIKKSTTELSTGEFANYVADIYLLTGVEPPPPENFNLNNT